MNFRSSPSKFNDVPVESIGYGILLNLLKIKLKVDLSIFFLKLKDLILISICDCDRYRTDSVHRQVLFSNKASYSEKEPNSRRSNRPVISIRHCSPHPHHFHSIWPISIHWIRRLCTAPIFLHILLWPRCRLIKPIVSNWCNLSI